MMRSSSTFSIDLMTISGSRLYKINAYTGAVTLNVSISPLTAATYVQNQCFLSLQTIGSTYRLINWTSVGTSTSLASRILSNITWPFPQMPGAYTLGAACFADFNAGIAVRLTRAVDGSGVYSECDIHGISLTTGQVLWNTLVSDDATYSSSCNVADHGKIAWLTQKGYFLCYDLATGKQVWQRKKEARTAVTLQR